MKSFKVFLEQFLLLEKLNEGDVFEGIFSIAIAQYLRDDKISKSEINKLRSKIEPRLFKKGSITFHFDPFNRGVDNDNFSVHLTIKLKAKAVKGAFGKNAEALFSRSEDIGNIGRKIDVLVSQFAGSKMKRRIDGFITKIEENNQRDEIDLYVIATGKSGDLSGGKIKGDVKIKIVAKSRNKNADLPDAIIGELNFSVKSTDGAQTIANLSPYKGTIELAKRFGVPFSSTDLDKNTIRIITSTAKTPEHIAEKRIAVQGMFDVLASKFKSISSKKLTPKAFDFFEDMAFGKDKADIFNVGKTRLKEITSTDVDELRKTVILKVVLGTKGTNTHIRFVDVKTGKLFFRIRAKIAERKRHGIGLEIKMMVEAGRLVGQKR